jgi:hypothetical protein
MHHDVATGNTQVLNVRVWPNFAPPEEGKLIDLDNLSSTTITGQLDDIATVRMSEMNNNDDGFAWILPDPIELTCATITDDNFGGFNTGYK